MDPGLKRLNSLSHEHCYKELLKCCGSSNWARRLTHELPVESVNDLNEAAERIWWSLGPEDWLEAFRSHPKIGEKKPQNSQATDAGKWSEQEQSGVAGADRATLHKLTQLNQEYEQKFGFIFIVCATGKSSSEMLAILRERLKNEREKEIRIAASEQAKITGLRLEKLLQQ